MNLLESTVMVLLVLSLVAIGCGHCFLLWERYRNNQETKNRRLAQVLYPGREITRGCVYCWIAHDVDQPLVKHNHGMFICECCETVYAPDHAGKIFLMTYSYRSK